MSKINDKLRAISAAVTAIEKQFGKGSIMPLQTSGDAAVEAVPVISSGSIGLDEALGVGGYPRGRVVEIFGPEGSGKTTLVLHAIAQAQRAGGVCAIVDAEHRLDVVYARKIGVDLGQLLVSQPDCGEQALEIADQLCRTGAVDLVAVDSVAALTPKAEIEGEFVDPHMGLQARLLSQALRKITAVAAKQNTLVIFTNPRKPRIAADVFSTEATGNNALKFYASVRIEVQRIVDLYAKNAIEGGAPFAARVRVKVVKNKVASPFREAEFSICVGEGIDVVAEVFDLAVARRLIENVSVGAEGTVFWFGENRWKDRETAIRNMRPTDIARLTEILRAKVGAHRDDCEHTHVFVLDNHPNWPGVRA